MLAKLAVIGAAFCFGLGGLSAQTVPVAAKIRLTTELLVAGKVVSTKVQEGYFYRASSGWYLKQWRKVGDSSAPGDVNNAALTDAQHNVEYALVYDQHRAIITPPYLFREIAAPASEPAPPGGFLHDTVEGVACVKRPLRLNVSGQPHTELGYSCVAEGYNDLELKREFTDAVQNSPDKTKHVLYVLFEIQFGKEPDPALFDLKSFTIERLEAPKPPDSLSEAKDALRKQDYAAAKPLLAAYVKDNPNSVEALGLTGDAHLGLKEYEDAAQSYLAAIQLRPDLWPAHKNLVIVYAALSKWAEFDKERALLQDARAKRTTGLSPQDSDVIDVLYVGTERYIVRGNAELEGKFKIRYRFMHFGADGKLDFWIACESDDVDQATFAKAHPTEAAAGLRSFSLDSYTAVAPNADGKGYSQTHGTIKFYPDGEPTYETVRTDVLKVLVAKTAPISTSTWHGDKPPTANPTKPR
jgi:tetratricopeptide (TPR) repeat protein